jgi:plastocyanin
MILLILAGAGLLFGCGEDSPTSPRTPTDPGGSTGTVIISITGMDGFAAFDPATATLTAGQSVAWRNDDTRTHRPILTDVFDTKQMAPGTTSAATPMNTPGHYDYKCTIHPSEQGAVIVEP